MTNVDLSAERAAIDAELSAIAAGKIPSKIATQADQLVAQADALLAKEAERAAELRRRRDEIDEAFHVKNWATSALHLLSDLRPRDRHVSEVPIRDLSTCKKLIGGSCYAITPTTFSKQHGRGALGYSCCAAWLVPRIMMIPQESKQQQARGSPRPPR